MKKVKFFAILMSVCFVATIALPMQTVLAHNASKMFSAEEPLTVDFSKIDFSVEEFSKDHYRISYLVGSESVNYVLINDKNKEVVILLLEGEEIYRIPSKKQGTNKLISTSQIETKSNTYYYWDNLLYVSGQYIKYPHVDRDNYGISPFSSWSGAGTKLYHNQIDHATSTTLVSGGGAVIGAALGGLLGIAVGGVYGGVVGSVVGAVITAALIGFGLVYFADEYDCIWWMVGKTFVQWLFTYAYTIYQLFQVSPVMAQAFVSGAFASCGYFRVGTATLWDAVGAGDP